MTAAPPRRGEAARLDDWMRRNGIRDICVVSPHLDDAAFSLATFLALPGLPPRRVVTVFTHAGPSTGTDYARATGFTDPWAEFVGRRAEDAAAMARLGVDFVQSGAESGRQDALSANLAISAALDGPDPAELLVLLPLGAGRPLGPAARLWRRILRVPPGSPPHSDHLWVRDHVMSAARTRGVRVGLYAEVPYQWANSASQLLRLAQSVLPSGVEDFHLPANAAAKLDVASDYGSQVTAEFGTRRSYQLRTASVPERLYLARG